MEKKFPKFIYEVEYLDLVENPKVEIEKLLNFCDLDWDESCLNHDKKKELLKRQVPHRQENQFTKQQLNLLINMLII